MSTDTILYAKVGDGMRGCGNILEIGLVKDATHVAPISIGALYPGLKLTPAACEFLSERLGSDSVDRGKSIFVGAAKS